MSMLFLLVILATLLLANVTAIVHYVTANGSDIESLEHYLSNTSKYFSNNSRIIFRPGQHYLINDLVIHDVTNLSLIGENSCKINCDLYSSVKIFNVTDFTLENINFKNCNKNYSADMQTNFDYDYVSINKLQPSHNEPSRNASIFLYECTSVVINNISVLVTAGTTGIFIANIKGDSTIAYVSIRVDYTMCSTKDEHTDQSNGILLYYDNQHNKITSVQLDNFQFISHETCSHLLQYAITVLLFQKNTNVSITISKSNFTNLRNVSALYYYGETCGIFTSNILTFTNCVISNNTGNFGFRMFEIILYSLRCFDTALLQQYCNQQYNNISFMNCTFNNNQNIPSMIHITPASSRAITGYIYITNSSFCNNNNSHFLILESGRDNVWQLSNFVLINNANISSNSHHEGHDLIFATNSWMKFIGTTFIVENSLYKNIIKLHLSGSTFQNNITIVKNTARQIYDGSYILLLEGTFLNVSFNTVYMVVKLTLPMGIITQKVCGFQFYTKKGNLDDSKDLPFKVISVNNVHMTSKDLPGSSLLSTHCQWLAGTAFSSKGSTDIYKQIFDVKNLIVGNDNTRPVPLSVCKCKNSSLYVNCYSPHLGSIFPGETLTVQLSVQKEWISYRNSSKTIIAENLSDQDNCSIVHASELSQTHFSSINYCNSYSYTLWPKNITIKECQLFIGLSNMPEMFYVQVKPCPKGFTFQEQRKACYCDPLLNNKVLSITSCNLTEGTISRPANSWIYAQTDENSHVHNYLVSPYCPFDHCLPESSNLDLSNPDSQCQFNRTGVLCGECKPGLSVVLGTPQCKPCSDIYLLLLIPIARTGIALIVVFYIFNLTVRSGTMNTLTFYVNIVGINISTLFPGCQSITCIIVSHLNIDFRTKTCFYNGMDDYSKEWLRLLHPFYFISIAVSFIVLSRYSATVQRLTAQRALPVLATLILLSYTKVMLSVCNVLFRYSTIIHLPSNKTELVWSISTTTPLLGLKIPALFIVSIFLFFILLPFNVTLLFTRKLSRFKFVTKLKPLLDTYFSAYKDKAFYWTGLMLLIRLIVYILSVLGKDISSIAISILLAGLLCLHGVVQPFKNRFHNIQESVVIMNLLAAHVALLYKEHSLGLQVSQILLTIGVAYFIMAIVFHCCMHRWGSTILKCVKWVHHEIHKRKTPSENIATEMESLSSKIADVTYNYREFQEPLVEYDS